MFDKTYIHAKAWMVREVVNLVLQPANLSVDKIFLIGSYACGTQDEWSDLDFLVQLKGPRTYPTWNEIVAIHKKMESTRVHIIFGTEAAQASLHEKHKQEVKSRAYIEIPTVRQSIKEAV